MKLTLKITGQQFALTEMSLYYNGSWLANFNIRNSEVISFVRHINPSEIFVDREQVSTDLLDQFHALEREGLKQSTVRFSAVVQII